MVGAGWGWFFFSSRGRHTRFDCDWSSDVCSSDLEVPQAFSIRRGKAEARPEGAAGRDRNGNRSEERRVGKSVDLGGRRIIKKKNRTFPPTAVDSTADHAASPTPIGSLIRRHIRIC